MAAGHADVYGFGSGNVYGLFADGKGVNVHTYSEENLTIPNDETFSITYLSNEVGPENPLGE